MTASCPLYIRIARAQPPPPRRIDRYNEKFFKYLNKFNFVDFYLFIIRIIYS